MSEHLLNIDLEKAKIEDLKQFLKENVEKLSVSNDPEIFLSFERMSKDFIENKLKLEPEIEAFLEEEFLLQISRSLLNHPKFTNAESLGISKEILNSIFYFLI